MAIMMPSKKEMETEFCSIGSSCYQEGHYNYAKEGFQLLVQLNILSECKIVELKWSQTYE